MQLSLFAVTTCRECPLFLPTQSNYGWCKKKKVGSLDRSVYENSEYCEMEKSLQNNQLLNKRLSGKISHTEMYEQWRK